MAEKITSLHDVKADASQTIDQIKADVDSLIDELDFSQVTRKVEDFGRQNPLALAFGALTVGLAAGLMMRKSSSSGMSQSSDFASSSLSETSI